MEFHLRPELEKLIQADVQRGPYQSVQEFVEHAVAELHEREDWLAKNRAEIAAKIDEGYAAAQRGELIDAEEVRSRMQQLKQRELGPAGSTSPS